MKKTFTLNIEGKNPDRVLDAIKHEVRKYVKREKGKALPAGATHWGFDCRFGANEEVAEPLHLGEITKQMDMIAQGGSDSFYVEIIARPAVYTPRERELDLDDELDE